LLVFGVALLGATTIYLLARGRQAAIVHDSDEARLRAMDQRIAALEARLRMRGGEGTASSGPSHLLLPAPPPAVGETTESGGPHGPARPLPAAPAIDEVALQRQYFGDLDVRLASEARDPVWSAETEEKLRAVHELRPRISVESARCGQTMCRVETRTAEAKDDTAALNNFIEKTVSLLPEAVVADGEAPGHHVVYFARRGAEFPPMTASEGITQ
jgi:hypothetical protein